MIEFYYLYSMLYLHLIMASLTRLRRVRMRTSIQQYVNGKNRS